MRSESIDLTSILESLNLAVWEQDENGAFRRLGPLPAELAERFPVLATDPLSLDTAFRYLTHFIESVSDRWDESPRQSIRSGTWEESDSTGTQVPFCAHAITADGRRVLVLEALGVGYEDKKAILQAAREGSLAYEELQRTQQALAESEQRQRVLIAELDQRVAERTSELARLNEQLHAEIDGHLRTQQALLDHQEELRALADRLVVAEEKERRRIAVGLHDDLGQLLAMANIRMGQLAASQPDVRGEVGEVRLLLKSAITRVRTLTFELSSPLLHELGLDAALENLVQQFGARAEIVTHYESHDPKQAPENTAIIVYQAVRELLHNVEKHAAASEVTVSCRWHGSRFEVTVADDGRGLSNDASALTDTFGLFNVQQRIDHLGGSFLLQSAPNRGTQVTLRVPLSESKSSS